MKKVKVEKNVNEENSELISLWIYSSTGNTN